MSLGARISRLRKQRGWTQDVFAEKVGVHGRHVSRIERDKMRPSAGTLAKVAEAFEIHPDELLIIEGQIPIGDPILLRAFQQAQELDGEDKAVVIRIVHALLTKKRMEQAIRLETV